MFTSQGRRFRFRFTRSLAADGNGDYGGEGWGDFGGHLGTFGVWGHLGIRGPMGPYRDLGGYYGMLAFGVFGGPYGHIGPYRTDGGGIYGAVMRSWGRIGVHMGLIWGYVGPYGDIWGYAG